MLNLCLIIINSNHHSDTTSSLRGLHTTKKNVQKRVYAFQYYGFLRNFRENNLVQKL
jgi:hypothetical protein